MANLASSFDQLYVHTSPLQPLLILHCIYIVNYVSILLVCNLHDGSQKNKKYCPMDHNTALLTLTAAVYEQTMR